MDVDMKYRKNILWVEFFKPVDSILEDNIGFTFVFQIAQNKLMEGLVERWEWQLVNFSLTAAQIIRVEICGLHFLKVVGKPSGEWTERAFE